MSDENKDHKRSTSINDLAEAAARHLPARIPLASTGNSQPKKDKILFGIDDTRYPDIFRPFGNETVKTIVEGFNDAANGLKPWLREIIMAAPDVLDKIYQSSTPGFADFITSDAKNIIDGKTSRQIAINKSLAATP